MRTKRITCWWCISCAAAWLVALVATAILSKYVPDWLLGRISSAKVARDVGYGLASLFSLIVSPFVARRIKELDELDKKDLGTRLNELLGQNVEMLAGAFALVAGVVLLIAELGNTLGMPRATNPKMGILMPELVGFVVAITATLYGRWQCSGRMRLRLAWLSCMATLTCFLALGPYFWYQRARTTPSEAVRSAFEVRLQSGRDSLASIERMLVRASANGNYALLQAGVDRLADTNGPRDAHESCLVRLHGYLVDDSLGSSIVTQGLNSIRNVSRASGSSPPGGRGWPYDQWWLPTAPRGIPDCMEKRGRGTLGETGTRCLSQ
jgi:hypothetical protein